MKNVNNVNKTKSKNCFKLIVVKINNQINKERNFRKIVISFITIASIVFTISVVYGASDPTLVNKINSALKKLQAYLVKFATPAAGVAIASGVLMRKFSFGNEEKMAIGKKVIINAIIGYAIVLSIDLILKFIDSLV